MQSEKVETHNWPKLKKAIYDVIIAAELNGRKYIFAYELVDKLYEAALTAQVQDVAGTDPVGYEDYKSLFEECQLARDEIGFLGSVPDCIRYLEAELNEAKKMPKVAIKDLHWVEFCTDFDRYFQSNTVFGQYQISYIDKFSCWELYSPKKSPVWRDNFSRHKSIEEAKDAAQVDYEAMIPSIFYADMQNVSVKDHLSVDSDLEKQEVGK